MKEQPTGPQQEGLLPSGTIVELEVYCCVVRLPELGETPAIAVTCDTLNKALVLNAVTCMEAMSNGGVVPGSERFYKELATAFQLQCAKSEAEDCALWILKWNELLDRRLMSIVKLEIQ